MAELLVHHTRLVLVEDSFDVVIHVHVDLRVDVVDLKTKECRHDLPPGDLKVPGVCMHELVHESLARGCVDEESMDDEVLTFSLHEDSLLIVDSGISMAVHPSRYADVPLPCCLATSSMSP